MLEKRVPWSMILSGLSLLLIFISAPLLQRHWQAQTPIEQQWQLVCSTQGNYWVKLNADGKVIARSDREPLP